MIFHFKCLSVVFNLIMPGCNKRSFVFSAYDLLLPLGIKWLIDPFQVNLPFYLAENIRNYIFLAFQGG